jgi:prepilin-type N-terminal cleavage/methylation domain-containing protein
MNTTQRFKVPKNGGFTLIELLVTTTLTTIILLTATTILMTFFVSNSRTTIRRQIKAEGSRALSRMEFVARGASSCSNDAVPTILDPSTGVAVTPIISFTNVDGSIVRFYPMVVSSVRNIVMRTTTVSGTTTENLLSTFALPSSDATFQLNCVRETDAKKLYANIRFNLTNPGAGTITETFTTLVVLRNSE